MKNELLEWLEWLSKAPRFNDVRSEIEDAEAIRKWCLRALNFTEGDRVRICRKINTDNGWKPYAAALAIGATGIVGKIDFNRYSRGGFGAWHAEVILDREWVEDSATGKTWWNGPADQTPEGMIEPSQFDQTNYPQGRKHTFSLLVEDLEPEIWVLTE